MGQIGQNSLTEMANKKNSSGIYKNSSDLQQGNVKLWWSISWRSGVRFFLFFIFFRFFKKIFMFYAGVIIMLVVCWKI